MVQQIGYEYAATCIGLIVRQIGYEYADRGIDGQQMGRWTGRNGIS